MRHSFERFGIQHLSPSSLNTWRSAPGLWARQYIARIKDGGNSWMWRGNAVETGMAALLRGETSGEALNAAYMNFDLNALGTSEDGVETERAMIEPMLKQLAKWKAPSELNATQIKIEYWFDPIPIPIIGYLDFAFDGIDVDLKTTKACPKPATGPRPDHVGQASIYRAARERAGGLLYVSGANHTYFEVTDEMMDEALEQMRATALSLNNFLARMDTKEDILRSLPIDYSHWKAPKTKIPLEEILLAG